MGEELEGYLLDLATGIEKEFDGIKAFLFAAGDGKTAFVKSFLAAGSLYQHFAGSALREAARNGHTDTVNALLEADTDVHYRDDSALELAAENGHAETVAALLKGGAKLTSHFMYKAAWGGHTEAARVLLEAGADIHYQEDATINVAESRGHTETVAFLKSWLAGEAGGSPALIPRAA